MPELLSQLPDWAPAVACGVYVVVEYFLGKTDLVKGNSVLECALNVAKAACEAVKDKKPPQV